MTAEELLMSEESEAFEYSNVITIDRESRAINVPLGQEMLGVEGDKSVSIKHFLCPKIVGDNIDIDLSEYNLYANYTISDEKGNQKSNDVLQTPCKNIVVNGENITFDWEISEWVTQEDGFIAFSIVAKKSVGGILQTRWYTTPAVGRVLRTIKEGENLAQKYPDVIDNLMNRVSDLERILANGGGTGGSITVDDALSETSTNPVQNKVVTEEFRRLSEKNVDKANSLWAIIQKTAFAEQLTDAELLAFKTAWGIESGGEVEPDEPIEPDTRTLLYQWDFTGSEPLVDKVTGATATIASGSPTLNSNGLTIASENDCLRLIKANTINSFANCDIELEMGVFEFYERPAKHLRLVTFTEGYNTGFICRNTTGAWSFYYTTWVDGTASYNSISNKKVKLSFDSENRCTAYVDGVEIIGASAFTITTLQLGSNSNSAMGLVIKGIKIYERGE